ncbi:MAG: helix-turn-helix domain-containing protein [Coriobacteriales bacterium]|nr:helix-turn-helix domain-containing protein [Coriobacteriales bacterium]
MTKQIRTWVESHDQKTGLGRWDISINGTPIPGGYIVELETGGFEAHYPHLVPFIKPSLAQAKERLEWAPPIMGGGQMHIASYASAEDTDGFISIDDAAQKLGVSRYRINAMVSNGKLCAYRKTDGSVFVSKTSLENLLNAAK